MKNLLRSFLTTIVFFVLNVECISYPLNSGIWSIYLKFLLTNFVTRSCHSNEDFCPFKFIHLHILGTNLYRYFPSDIFSFWVFSFVIFYKKKKVKEYIILLIIYRGLQGRLTQLHCNINRNYAHFHSLNALILFFVIRFLLKVTRNKRKKLIFILFIYLYRC